MRNLFYRFRYKVREVIVWMMFEIELVFFEERDYYIFFLRILEL